MRKMHSGCFILVAATIFLWASAASLLAQPAPTSASAPATAASTAPASQPAWKAYGDKHASYHGDSHKGDMATPALKLSNADGAVTVSCDYWTVAHNPKAGGCIASIVFANGTGKNLLAGPAGSRIRFVKVNDSGRENAADYPGFYERLDANAKVQAEKAADGSVVVTAEGSYCDKGGKTIPVRFVHRYTYGPWGLLTSDLDIQPQEPVAGVVEVGALELPLRSGLTDAYVREHPICNPSSDLRSGNRWMDFAQGAQNYRQKYMPLHVVCFERGVEGIDVFASSDLAQWDTQLCPDVGFGEYAVSRDRGGQMSVDLCPYSFPFRRVPVTLDKPSHFRLYIGLPFIRDFSQTGTPFFHAAVNSNWASDADLKTLADAGVRLVRFHNDYRQDGPFWHDAMYPPYDEAGMRELRRVVDTSHKLGMKAVPYMSLKEFHPESQGYAENAEQWAEAPGTSVRDIHTWAGSGQYGRLMCMESPWLERRKKDADTILSDIPWDGLYFDWVNPLPCRNPAHKGGLLHSDTDGFLSFLNYARTRIGPNGVLFLHLSGHPYMTAENMADLSFIYEDVGGRNAGSPLPGEFPSQCDFVPVTGRQLAAGARAGTNASRRFMMTTFAQGHPASTYAPIAEKTLGYEVLQEMRLFQAQDLQSYRFARASEKAVETGGPPVYAALWYKPLRAMVYVGNISDRAADGRAKFDIRLLGDLAGKKGVLCRTVRLDGQTSEIHLSVAHLAEQGVPYQLKEWESAVVHVEAE